MTLSVCRLAQPAVLLLAAALVSVAQAEPGPAQQAVLARQAEAARAVAPGFAPSAERGRTLFMSSPAAGKPDSPSCTSCHTTDLRQAGKTRAGKAIEPMAPSVTPARLSDPGTVEKWFRRNCPDVLGRDCTAAEKADLLAFLTGQ
jgi:cytochrome c peroxidase